MPVARHPRPELERVTTNLMPRAWQALNKTQILTGNSQTDVINRALQVYGYLEEVWARDGVVKVEVDGTTFTLKCF